MAHIVKAQRGANLLNMVARNTSLHDNCNVWSMSMTKVSKVPAKVLAPHSSTVPDKDLHWGVVKVVGHVDMTGSPF